MPRFALKIEYDGTRFSGWQKQKSQPSIQQSVEEALRKLEPGNTGIAAAGRTDAGVHALGQVAHVDLEKPWDPFRLSEAINFHLKPLSVAILDVAVVGDDFHARFSALERRYLFRLVARRAPVTLERGMVWQVGTNLDLERMREAASTLIGRHDFTTFRSTSCQADSPVKTLDLLDISEIDTPYGSEFRFDVRARSFLHNQVRSLVGTLERAGSGRWSATDVSAALQAKDRSACARVAPPGGLYLKHVRYAYDPFSSVTANK